MIRYRYLLKEDRYPITLDDDGAARCNGCNRRGSPEEGLDAVIDCVCPPTVLLTEIEARALEALGQHSTGDPPHLTLETLAEVLGTSTSWAGRAARTLWRHDLIKIRGREVILTASGQWTAKWGWDCPWAGPLDHGEGLEGGRPTAPRRLEG